MKHILLITSIMFFLPIQAQEVEKTSKTRHSFNLSAGIFGQGGITYTDFGITSSLGYQMYFPNRFILGLSFLTDQSFFVEKSSSSPNITYIRRIKAFSGGVQLGVHIIRKKRYDFSVMIVPHVNYQENLTKKYTIDIDKHELLKNPTTFVSMLFVAWHTEFYYKFNDSHSLGLNADLHVDMEWEGLNLLTEPLVVGRMMISYRINLPNN